MAMTILKWSLLALAAVAVVAVALRIWFGVVVNPSVINEIASNPQGERAGIVMALTLPHGDTLPVNYLREGNRVYAGADGLWWRSLRDGDVPVTVLIRGQSLAGRARVVQGDAALKTAVFRRLRPTAPAWLPDWLNAHLVVIELDAAT